MPRRQLLQLALGSAAAFALACSGSQASDSAPAEASAEAQASADAPVEAKAVAYFAGGCFWGVEYFMEKLPGVASVESGYMGGKIENPSYEQVSAHETRHLEAVRVNYDPDKVSYEAIAKRFYEIHDPTQANGQGPDIGAQYLSAVFVANDEERAVNEALISRLRERGYEVVTEIKPVTEFYDAEDYHQDYYVRHEKKPYCHGFVDRFGDAK